MTTDTSLAIIGGTGLTRLPGLEITHREVVHTPYGDPSGPVTHGVLHGREVMFLARHGYGHTIPPHRVNYRANIWALKHLKVGRVLAVAAVGAIHEALTPGSLAFPDQIIDYTWSRKHTFFEDDLAHVTHVDLTHPYDEELRRRMMAAAEAGQIPYQGAGTYGATQGPRLETAAEIRRLRRDGCDMVGMTGMPEAALAREAGLRYAACAVSVNWAAGLQGDEVTMEEIEGNLSVGMERVKTLLGALIPAL
ncbi:S-methyl-5'-thioinosine phosphorylase [Alkalilimnicola sp. S0819]|uniref:S-methyl-5'-thioinosine phosphorylase n=1 Tax=Alkalilimnicola sp. S0819 TaxID=2613922 RepID=UPI001261631E|nr:S-methyl-5'-thioinosine phosphorylase [Alkalilimnicola sp. S0819]KAB7627457.1 S-methyl-5'-thioinosine phosphorylase [Alkalilimnicola sp. S0819]MPQ15606.1 S-methyl-5'-thioinosine phosphorylase [Alkalilimnicola sp. S0819]